MSFDVFLTPIGGVSVDAEAVSAILARLQVERDEGGSGSNADIYGEDPHRGLMVNHIVGPGWEYVAELADTAPYAVLPVGVGTFVTRNELLGRLDPGMPDPKRAVSTGAELLEAIETAYGGETDR